MRSSMSGFHFYFGFCYGWFWGSLWRYDSLRYRRLTLPSHIMVAWLRTHSTPHILCVFYKTLLTRLWILCSTKNNPKSHLNDLRFEIHGILWKVARPYDPQRCVTFPNEGECSYPITTFLWREMSWVDYLPTLWLYVSVRCLEYVTETHQHQRLCRELPSSPYTLTTDVFNIVLGLSGGPSMKTTFSRFVTWLPRVTAVI